ncbi:MAG TPA: TIGR02710 family CRISPR-associated CARF protein [Hyphomicrobiaceae bacterium]|nr:TIGR02710 family CRISPR-associated CARF protein [Hyphomicrobiaceae bacterium]
MNEPSKVLLICTVGGSPEPVVASLKHWRPLRICFVHTPQSKGEIDTRILPLARAEGVEIDAGRFDLFELPDGQNLASCVAHLRKLRPNIETWVARGPTFRVVVDYTGGTKCMSAAIGIQASRWPCQFSYVGGKQRTKEGLGVVVSGAEMILYEENPWNALGYQAVDDFVMLFDQHAFVAAESLARRAKEKVTLLERKREFAALEHLAKGFDAWERFDPKSAKAAFDNVTKGANDLRAVLGNAKAESVLQELRRIAQHLQALCEADVPSRHHVVDLLANAKRRHDEGRYDDAVARLYRAIEATAQLALKERHGFDSTGLVRIEQLPESLRERWGPKAKNGTLALGLQDSYALLASLGDPLGEKFRQAGLNDETKSPLNARNRSILAHGFDRVSDKIFEQLWTATLALADVSIEDLPQFPVLARHSDTAAQR